MLELRNLVKRYEGRPAVDDVSLAVPAGEVLSLLGPSGCGKSTTLRLVAGLTEADGGAVVIAGKDVTRAPAAEREIGMVFQSLALFPHMTVAENIGFGLKCKGVAARARLPKIGEALERVRLAGFERRMPWQLSGGQRQRVALARAIVTGPKLLLLDEPFSALDRKLRDEMQRELRDVVREVRITTLFVTHDQEEAIRLSDRIAVIQNGRVVQLDTPRAIYERPRTRFVAEFVGSPNLLPMEPGPGFLNVRPERIGIHVAPPEAHAIEGTITSMLYEGEVTTFRIALAKHPGVVWVVREHARDGIETRTQGQTVFLSWGKGDAHLISDDENPS